MNEYTLPIETYFSNNNPLNVMSNFYYKFIEAHNTKTYKYYMISYKNAKRVTTQVRIDFCEDKEATVGAFNSYVCTGEVYRCQFYLVYDTTENYYTAENFNYTNALNECVQMGERQVSIYDTYANAGSTYASNLWQENYLNYEKWKTIEVQPNPSPSPEPEEPSTETTDYTNWFILLSAILMLIVMYKFINSIFARGEG